MPDLPIILHLSGTKLAHGPKILVRTERLCVPFVWNSERRRHEYTTSLAALTTLSEQLHGDKKPRQYHVVVDSTIAIASLELTLTQIALLHTAPPAQPPQADTGEGAIAQPEGDGPAEPATAEPSTSVRKPRK
jgi:hypothetical protein